MDEKCGWMYFVSADIGIPSVLRVPAVLALITKRGGRFANKIFARPIASQRRLHEIEITSHYSIVLCTRPAHVLPLLLSRSYQ
jgi:hypothetical protein